MPSDRELILLVVRHGETSWNAENRWQGQRDTPLSDTGRAQARLLQTRFAQLWNGGGTVSRFLPGPPELVFVSDLSRAAETASLITATLTPPPPIETLPLLRERSFGAWEGLTREEVRAKFGDIPHSEPEDGEPFVSVHDRMVTALAHIWDRTAETPRGVALVVGHGGSLRMLLARALGSGIETSRHFRLDNTGVSVLSFHGATAETSVGRVHLINDTSHLQ